MIPYRAWLCLRVVSPLSFSLRNCTANLHRSTGRTARALACVLFSLLALPLLAQRPMYTIPTSGIANSVAVNPATNKIYVTGLDTNSMTVFDVMARRAVTVGVGDSPSSVAVNPVTNKIYVSNLNSSNVTVFDEATDSSTSIPTGYGPMAVAVNTVTNKIYVANYYGSSVTVIDGNSNSVTATVTLPSGAYAVAANPVTNRVYALSWGHDYGDQGTVTVIDGATDASIAVVFAGTNPTALSLNAVTGKLYVVNQPDDTLTVVNPDNSATTVPVGSIPSAVGINPATNRVYVTNQGGTVTVLDGKTDTLIATLPAGVTPDAVQVNSLTNRIYVANQTGLLVIDGETNAMTTLGGISGIRTLGVNPVTNKVYLARYPNGITVIDGDTNTTATVPDAEYPNAIASNPVTNRTYVANAFANTVSVIDGSTNTTLAVVPVGSYPSMIAVNPATDKIYVANSDSSYLTVIDGGTNLTTNVAVNGKPGAVAVNPVTNKIYTANRTTGYVTVIDGATNTPTTIFTPSAYAVAVNPITNRIYVSNNANDTVTVINGVTHQVQTVPVGRNPQGIAVNVQTNKIYVANNGDDTVTVIDGATNETAAFIVGNSPAMVEVNPFTNTIYVPIPGDNGVFVADGATNEGNLVSLEANPTSVTVDPVFNKAYVANYSSNIVSVVEGTSNSSARITVGSFPTAIALNPITNRAYVANWGGDVTVIAPYTAQNAQMTLAITGINDSQTVTGNAVFSTTNSAPTFSVAVQSEYAPLAPAPTALYYQVDTAQAEWRMGTATSAPGANPGSYSLNLADVPIGLHFLYVYAAYGDEGTPENSSQLSGNSPIISSLAAYPFLILPAPTTTTLTADVNPQNHGSSVTFTATVVPSVGSGLPTGTVSFFDGGSLLDDVALDGNGSATYQTSGLMAGTHSIVATYSGDSVFAGSNSAALQQVVSGVPAGITIYSGDGQTSAVATAFGSPLVVTVTDSNGNPVPNATVTFAGTGLTFDGNGVAVTDSNGRASINATPTASGPLVVTASVQDVATSASFSLTAEKGSQTVDFSLASPVTYGVAPITLSATATSGLAVSFTVLSGPGFVDGDVLTVTGYGSIALAADQPGDSNYHPAAQVIQTLTVDKANASVTPDPSGKVYGGNEPEFSGTLAGFVATDGITATYTRSAGETVNGGPYTISATLNDPNSKLINYNVTSHTAAFTISKADLTVTVQDATRAYGAANPSFAGSLLGVVSGDEITASYSTTATVTSDAGTHPITAELNDPGNKLENYSVTNTPGTLTISPAMTTTSLTSSTTVVNLPGSFTLTAHVAWADGTPAGTVTFFAGTAELGSGTLNNGEATLSVSNIALGPQSLTAVFAASRNFAGSTSEAVPVTVYSGAQDYTFGASRTSVTVGRGQSVPVTLSFASVNGWAGNVSLTCGNLSANVTCSFAPATVPLQSGQSTGSSVLTISVAGNSAAASTPVAPGSLPVQAGMGLAAGLILLWWRRSRIAVKSALLFCLFLLLLSSCGESRRTPPPATGPTTVAITVTATGTSTGTSPGSPTQQAIINVTIPN